MRQGPDMTSTDAIMSEGVRVPRERHHHDEVMEVPTSSSPLLPSRPTTPPKPGLRAKLGLDGVARRTLGIGCLMLTVFLWTIYNFVASYIFADHTFDKPFFVVYFNTSMFAVSLVPRFFRYASVKGIRGVRNDAVQAWKGLRRRTAKGKLAEVNDDATSERLLTESHSHLEPMTLVTEKLNFRETAYISLEFSMLWFLANYFSSACLKYTSVASTTILSATSSMFTLIFCTMWGIEPFTARKLLGVSASFIGVILISTVDMSGKSDENRGSFPHKTPGQIAIGDSMAIISAVVYGAYVTVMKYRVGDEDRVDMQLFFGLVGVFNLVLLWPMFFILHWTGLEPFELPPSGKIWIIITLNAMGSFISDVSWAYALLLTTPLVVTVGLALNIPLSLIGQMLQYSQHSSFLYWIGATVVFMSFLVINNESHTADEKSGEDDDEANRDVLV